MTVGIIGKRGRNSTAWISACIAAGMDVRILAREAPHRAERAVSFVRFDFEDSSTHGRAMESIETLALATPSGPHQVDRELNLIKLAKQSGVRRIVKLSVIGADLNPPASAFAKWHGEIERELRHSDLTFAILRPNFFMQNMMLQMASVAEGVYAEPLGEASVSYVDVRDIADVAVAAIAGRLDSQTVTLTGGRSMNGYEVAETFSKVLGRPVQYVCPSLKSFSDKLIAQGVPPWHIDALVHLYEQVQRGHAAGLDRVSSGYQELIGRAPRSLDQFLREEMYH